jgi:monoterpene epsilon-lactone hydrolase
MSSKELDRANATWRALSPAHGTPVGEVRRRVEDFYAQFPAIEDARVDRVNAGGVPALWIATPQSSAERVILYLHGGGYALGSARAYQEVTTRIARAARAQVVVLDYRLAPENRFPAAVEDATAAYRWLLSRGVAPASIAIAGDSAGGGLTLATMLALRYASEPLPAAAVCISPWIDLELAGETIETKAAADPLVTREGLEQFVEWYLAGQDPRLPLASPLHADLHGLPPLLIQVGTAEILLDDARRIARRAREAGVVVTLEEFEEMPHVWHVFASFLPEGQRAIDALGAFVRENATPRAQGASIPG